MSGLSTEVDQPAAHLNVQHSTFSCQRQIRLAETSNFEAEISQLGRSTFNVRCSAKPSPRMAGQTRTEVRNEKTHLPPLTSLIKPDYPDRALAAEMLHRQQFWGRPRQNSNEYVSPAEIQEWCIAKTNAVTALATLITDPDPAVRKAAAESITASDDTRAGQSLYRGMSDADQEVKNVVLKGMAEHQDPRALDTLFEYAQADEAPLHNS
jgi:hypothetical protein